MRCQREMNSDPHRAEQPRLPGWRVDRVTVRVCSTGVTRGTGEQWTLEPRLGLVDSRALTSPGTEHRSCVVIEVTDRLGTGESGDWILGTCTLYPIPVCLERCGPDWPSRNQWMQRVLSRRFTGAFIFLIKEVIHAQLRLYISLLLLLKSHCMTRS